MSFSNLIKIFHHETRNEQTTDIIFLAKLHCLRYIPGYELKPAAASVRGGQDHSDEEHILPTWGLIT